MSYDIRFGVKVDGMDGYIAVVGEPELRSPTYNLGQMFRACTGWDFVQGEWYNCADVLPKIQRGLSELRFNRKKYEKYNPPNGWGSIDSAIRALASMEERMAQIVDGTWDWNTIPLEHLWVCW